MLPGFRFLFAAIVLSMSILVFGLGATALLRGAHEEFTSTPSWRRPEPIFAQPTETTGPVLAMLHVETPAAEESAGRLAVAPAEQAATASAEPKNPKPEPKSLKPEEVRRSRLNEVARDTARGETETAPKPPGGKPEKPRRPHPASVTIARLHRRTSGRNDRNS